MALFKWTRKRREPPELPLEDLIQAVNLEIQSYVFHHGGEVPADLIKLLNDLDWYLKRTDMK